ncbi:hypothetical protein V8C86DRAFT_262360 [Haematococcus lacustris]
MEWHHPSYVMRHIVSVCGLCVLLATVVTDKLGMLSVPTTSAMRHTVVYTANAARAKRISTRPGSGPACRLTASSVDVTAALIASIWVQAIDQWC